MRRVTVFESISLDGYFTDAKNDMSWAHQDDPELAAFTAENAKSGAGDLVFGRVTYEMMASFWPTAAGRKMSPETAEGMTKAKKIVFSKKLKKAEWENTEVVREEPAAAVKKLKAGRGNDLVVLGSGSIVAQLAKAGLVDEYQLMIVPIIVGTGRTLFEGLKTKIHLRRTRERVFESGSVFACYVPA